MSRPILAGLVWLVLLAPSAALADGPITVGGDPCESLTSYEPAPDVAYQPGVDAEGNPVAPADLDGGSGSILKPDREYRVDVTVPLSDVTNTSDGSGAARVADSDVNIGTVTVRDGKVYFDGQLIGDESQHALAEACAKRQARPAE